ncbi:MAG: ATP phosphoribosyltransferase regulatory subunit [Candidatus Pacearchaeota archaeon]|jgi:histidyl-tRNA synthetase
METVKGFRDIEDSSKRNQIRNIIESIFQLYNFKSVETPIIEYEEFVKGNNTTDEAVSDIFKLKDKGERELALRYEFTFQLKRLVNNKKLPYKRYQIGPVFRDEPVAGNRWRQFTQCDADIVGASLKDEAEILNLISEILTKLKIKFTINFNNRKLLNEILEELEITDKNKNQVIREIDKLDKLSEKEIKQNLQKYNAEKVLDIVKKPESYFEKYKAYEEIKELKKIASLYKIKLNFQPFLARGLSYYNGSIFEVKSEGKEGIKETIAAGGSYMVNAVQSTGISFGLDRLELISQISESQKGILIISLSQDKSAIELAEKIRKLNYPCEIAYGKPGKALEYANAYKIKYVIFLGEEEIKKKKFKLKDMASGKEKLITEKDLEKELKVIE